jgi:hypothetical protein
MSFLLFFVFGAIFACAQLAWSLAKRPMTGGYPMQGFLFSIFFGGLFYGSIIWLFSKLFM